MKAALFAILAGLCWGIGEFFTKQVLQTGRIGPLTAITIRSTVGWLVLGEAMTVRKAVAVGLIVAGVVLLTGEG